MNSEPRLLAPKRKHVELKDWDALLDRKLIGEPFEDNRVATLDRLSAAVFASKELRRDPAAVALAYWLRKSQITRLKERCTGSTPIGLRRVPAGTVFHIAPSNVDTMFVYSWALSYLAGNNNIVRISSSAGSLAKGLISIIDADILTHEKDWDGNVFVSYGHDDTVTAFFSLRCDHRVIWGGDQTVRMIRNVPLEPHASERAFASKFSFSIIAVDAVLAANDEETVRLGKAFAADIEAFGQKACSSPHAIYWVGNSGEAQKAQSKLENAVVGILGVPDFGASVTRVDQVFAVAAKGTVRASRILLGLACIQPKKGVGAQQFEIGGSVITHFCASSLHEVIDQVDRRTQTITHFGFSEVELGDFAVGAGTRGCDRIVPLGKALDFDAFWDGFDLMGDFTRLLALSI